MPSPSNSDRSDHSVGHPAIVLHEVTKTYRIKHNSSIKETFIRRSQRRSSSTEFHALEGVNFHVGDGESVAVMGHNGSGKSTTLKLISGVQRPDVGWVRTRGRIGGLLEVGAGFHPDLTGRDNVYLNAAILGMSKAETQGAFDEIIDFSGIGTEFLDTEVKRYSSGMRSRLGFAVAVHTNIDVLLVDEVLSVGDAKFRAKCNDKILSMREAGKTMFIVSHNAGQVQKLCERGILLKHGRVIFDGPIEEAVAMLQSDPSSSLKSPKGEEISVTGPIRSQYDKSPAKFGKPIGPEIVVETDAGSYQLFEKGLISHLADEDTVSTLPNGPILRIYLQSGGPGGSWGFCTGPATGSNANGETKTIPFQHGHASYSDAAGVSFTPR